MNTLYTKQHKQQDWECECVFLCMFFYPHTLGRIQGGGSWDFDLPQPSSPSNCPPLLQAHFPSWGGRGGRCQKVSTTPLLSSYIRPCTHHTHTCFAQTITWKIIDKGLGERFTLSPSHLLSTFLGAKSPLHNYSVCPSVVVIYVLQYHRPIEIKIDTICLLLLCLLCEFFIISI